MPLDQAADAPALDTILFHLSLFGEFCESSDIDRNAMSVACECLRDAVEEACRLALSSRPSATDLGSIRTALFQAEAVFEAEMPDLHTRTRAARGFSALVEALETPPAAERCSDRERRAAALRDAHRFATTLGVFCAAGNSRQYSI